uniref:Uncharacterized protein n=1 Tax=Avena sativa TaxID=4498 RepID=A0ACD5YVX3_AVESA
MQFQGPTFRRSAIVRECHYPPGRMVENTLRFWAISRWRGATDFARFFLRSCFAHLIVGTPPMFNLEEVRMGDGGGGLQVTFTNPYNAYHLLGQAFWCGAEFICLTVSNIYTKWDFIFPTPNHMHGLPYVFPDEDDE